MRSESKKNDIVTELCVKFITFAKQLFKFCVRDILVSEGELEVGGGNIILKLSLFCLGASWGGGASWGTFIHHPMRKPSATLNFKARCQLAYITSRDAKKFVVKSLAL